MLNALEQNWAALSHWKQVGGKMSWGSDIIPSLWLLSLDLLQILLFCYKPQDCPLHPPPHSACKSGSLRRTQSTQLPDACSFQRPFGVLKGTFRNLTTARTVQAVNGKAHRGLWRELWPLLRGNCFPSCFPFWAYYISLQLAAVFNTSLGCSEKMKPFLCST